MSADRGSVASLLRRGDLLKLVAGSALAALASCNDGAPSITSATGSAAKPTFFGAEVYESDDVARTIALLAAIGTKYVRVGVQVSQPFLDSLVATATQHGLRVILLSAYASQPVNLPVYASAAAQLQTRYASANPVWEIYNEPNLAASWGATPDVRAYIELLAATATALRAAGATDIWTGGTSGVDLNWLYNLARLGAYQSANGCAVHSYEPPGYARTEYLQAISYLPAGVGLHTTETCIASSVGNQSQFLDQMWYLHRELNLPTMVWCEFRDGTAGATGASNEPYGLVSANYAVKPVYAAAQALVQGDN